MWNDRYRAKEYAYGTEPNDFLRAHADRLKGPVLSLAEGEGRNAVFLAGLGLAVTGVDAAEIGLEKARLLAAARNVQIHLIHSDLEHFDPGIETYQTVVSIFAHVPRAIRQSLHRKVVRCLQPGGYFILEAYTPAQITRGTGGPRDPELCMRLDDLRVELDGLEFEIALELKREVVEGVFHTGTASVVQILACKK